MKFSELKGRAVVSLDSATKLGEVEDLLLEGDSRETVGVKVKTGLFGGTLVVPIAQVKSVGPDAVTVMGPVGGHGAPAETDTPPQVARVAESLPTEHPDPVTEVLPESQGAVPPEPSTDAGTAPIPMAATAQPVSMDAPSQVLLSAMFNDKVLTDEGTLLGDVHDVLIDPATLKVTGLLVGSGGLFSRPKEIPVTPEARYGEKLIAVPKGLVS